MKQRHRNLFLAVADQIQAVPSISHSQGFVRSKVPLDVAEGLKLFGMLATDAPCVVKGHLCGTTHCAIGWGRELSGKTYTADMFGWRTQAQSAWLFGSDWDGHRLAWTARAAAHRIYYFLLKGDVPPDFIITTGEDIIAYDWKAFTTKFSYKGLWKQLKSEIQELRSSDDYRRWRGQGGGKDGSVPVAGPL